MYVRIFHIITYSVCTYNILCCARSGEALPSPCEPAPTYVPLRCIIAEDYATIANTKVGVGMRDQALPFA